MRKGFDKVTLWGYESFKDYEYIVASVTSTPNLYMPHRGFTYRKKAIKEANRLAILYDEEYVVIQMP